MTKLNIQSTSITEAQKLLNDGHITSVELTEQCLSKIESHDGMLGAFLSVDRDDALSQARASDERRRNGKTRGPLDGIPLGLKDNFLHQNQPCSAGSKLLEGYISPYDGGAVRHLREAGAVLFGRMNCDEFAMGSSNEKSAYKPCANPWNLKHVPGGSSGGSAAGVAAGMCFGSLGTDTGGSIRQPASLCGVVGLKPTYGRVSRFGVVAFASSLDQVGPFANDVESCATIFDAISGHDARDSTSAKLESATTLAGLKSGVKGLKIGLPKEFFPESGVDEEVASIVKSAAKTLEDRGAELVDVSLPHTDYAVATYYVLATAEAASNLARYDGVRYGPRLAESEGLEPMYRKTRGTLFGDEVKRRILLGNYVLSAGYADQYYVQAQKVRRKIYDDFMKAFEECDLILGPTSPTPAFKFGEKSTNPLEMYLSDIFTISTNLAGTCGLSVPGGLTKEGLPVGVQMLGKPFDESTILKAAYALEQALNLDTCSF